MQQRDRVASADTTGGQTCGDRPHPGGVLPPGDRLVAARSTNCYPIGMALDSVLEQLTGGSGLV
jgi:hypothetical protein